MARNASAIYPLYVDVACDIVQQYMSLITPSRWMTKTGQGVPDEWVDKMINSDHFVLINDYYNALDCFNQVELKGGVNYFLYDKAYHGKCFYRLMQNKKESAAFVRLNEHGAGIVIRDMQALEVFIKIRQVEGDYVNNENFSSLVGPQHFFDKLGMLTTRWKGYKTIKEGDYNIKYYLNRQVESTGFGWIKNSDIPKNTDVLPLHKVYLSKAYNGGDAFPHQIIGKPFYGEPNSVCSQTYLVIGYDASKHKLTEEQCRNIVKYMSTRFFRYLVFIKKKTQDNPSSVFRFVPLQDFTTQSYIDWSKPIHEIDQQLYKKYDIPPEEQSFIERLIKPME